MGSFSSDSFSSPSSSKEPSNEEILGQIKEQLAVAYAQEFFGTLRDKCFAKCITKPSSSLSSGESSCVSRCVERYIEANTIIQGAVLSSMPRY